MPSIGESVFNNSNRRGVQTMTRKATYEIRLTERDWYSLFINGDWYMSHPSKQVLIDVARDKYDAVPVGVVCFK